MNEAVEPAMLVPAAMREALVEAQGDRAREWVERVPSLVAELLERWSCVRAGPRRSGWEGIVLPVRRADGSSAMLKVSFPGQGTAFEATVLATWAGRGAVKLLDRDDAEFAMLLEAIGPEPLGSVADSEQALSIAGRLARRLAVPAPPGPTRMREVFARWTEEIPEMATAAGQPLAAEVVDAAVATCRELGPEQPETLLHGDLNQTNVLRGEREDWLAIDPAGLVGEVGFECLTHLRDRWTELRHVNDPDRALRRRVEAFADGAEIDVARARRWAQARSVVASLGARLDGVEQDELHDWFAASLAE